MSPRASTAEGAAPADTRREILRAAAAAISQHGVRGLRIEHVAARAGVANSLLYYYFTNRNGLVRAALDYSNQQAPSTALVEAQHEGSGYEAVLAALLAELDETPEIRDNNIVWNEAAASAVFDTELRPDVERVTRAWEEAVAAGIRRGIADGSIREDADPRLSARIVTVLVDGISERWLAGAMSLEDAHRTLRVAMERFLRAGAA